MKYGSQPASAIKLIVSFKETEIFKALKKYYLQLLNRIINVI